MSKSTYLILIFAFSAFLLGCGSESTEETPVNESPKPVAVKQETTPIAAYRTLSAAPGAQSNNIIINGRTQAIETLQLVSEVQGKAIETSKLFNEGVRVRKGETLIRIEDTRYRLNLKAQKSQFQSALVGIMPRIQLDFASDSTAWGNYLNQFDAAQILPPLPEVKNNDLRNFLSVNGIFSTYYNIKSAEEALPKYTIKAPFNGVIAQSIVTKGSIINPGTPLMTLNRTDVYELKAAVSSADIQRFKVGQKLELTHNNTGETWTGNIHRIGSNIDPATQAVPMFIRVSGKNIRAGLFMEARMATNQVEDVVIIPNVAMNRNNQVHLIKDSLVILKNVEPVYYGQRDIWVKGLAKGDRVITEELIQPIVGTKAVSK